MPPTEQKLTKKQKKALAFRTRSKKLNQSDGDACEHETKGTSGPALENEGHSRRQGHTVEVGGPEAKNVSMEPRGQGKARMDGKAGSADGPPSHSLKRKRESDIVQVEEKRKKVKLENDTADSKGKERLILFVGNLKYTTTVDAIKEHFSSCDLPPVIRLLTPKVSPEGGKQTTKSKGCAFLEFSNGKSLQQALKLHHSKLDGRVINVELTAGGGGKGEARLKKLQERNERLHSQRKKKGGKDGTKALKGVVMEDQSQRYSATSGVGQVSMQKRTWTVGNVADEKGSKRQRRQVKRAKNQATGVNAIPVVEW